MSNPLTEIDKLFRDLIEKRSEKPSPDVWDKIESDIEMETSYKYIRKYRSLKRNVSVALLFISALVIFGTVKLLELNSKVAKLRNDSTRVVKLQAANQNKTAQTTDIKTSASNEKTSVDGTKEVRGEMPAIAGQREEDYNGDKNGADYVDQRPILTAPMNKSNSVAAKQLFKDQNSRTRDDVTNAIPLAAADEFNDHSNSPDVSSVQKNFSVSSENLFKNLFSLTATSFSEYGKKYFADPQLPAVTIPGSQLPVFTVATIPKNSEENGSRLSLAFQFSANANWNRVIENKKYDRRHNNNGGGGSNGGGNSGGGPNGSGGSWGGHHEDHDDLRKSEDSRRSYTEGVALGYVVNKKLSIHTGLNYQQNSSKVKDKKIYADKDRDGQVIYQLSSAAGYANFTPPGNSNPNVHDSIMISRTRNYSNYLGIPLTVEYRLLSSAKFSLAAFAGGQANFLVYGKTYTVLGEGTPDESSETAKTNGLKSNYFSFLTGITGEMKVSKNLSLTLAPTGQFGLTDINTKRSVKTRTNHLGVTAGVKFRF